MSKINQKNTQSKLFLTSLLSLLIMLNGCASSEKEKSKKISTPTNKNTELATKSPVESPAKNITPIKTSPIETSAKKEKKVEETIDKKPKITLQSTKKVNAESEVKKSKNLEVNKKDVEILPEAEPEIYLGSLDQLPLTLNGGWIVDIKKTPTKLEEECVLYHERIGFFDGYKDSNLKVYLTSSQIMIESDSNFDFSYPDTGLYVEDNNGNQSFHTLIISSQKTIASITFDLDDYLNMPSKSLMVKTGFWPSWPVTETKTITFPFNEINIMSNTLNTCTSLFVE